MWPARASVHESAEYGDAWVLARASENGRYTARGRAALRATVHRYWQVQSHASLQVRARGAGGDRGGVQDLIASIKSAKLPIICICNDKYKTSLKSLKNHCIEIGWSKPTKQQASQRLRGIAAAEGLAMNQARTRASVDAA